MTDGSAVLSPVSKSTSSLRIVDVIAKYAMVGILIVLIVLSSAFYPGFLAPQNVLNILSQNAPVGIVAIGMTFVMIAGGFDLSVGSIYAVGATFYAAQANALPLPLAAALTVALGLACGLANGLGISFLRVNPFVATLGSSSVFLGAAMLYSRSGPILVDDLGFQSLGLESWLGIPISIWLYLALFVIGWIILSRTVYGRTLYAVGGNPEAARLAGLRVEMLRVSTYAIVGMLSAVAGMVIASRVGMGQASIGGTVALDAISVVIIGGTSLFGGSGAVWRTGIGMLILATLNNLFDSLALDSNLQLIVKGAIVIGAVSLDAFIQQRR